MYHHVKKLMYTVRVDAADPAFGNMLLEQFGGANGELAAAMQYSIQGLNCEDPERKDLLMDIGTEELSHLEVVGSLARLHLKPMKFDLEYAEARPFLTEQLQAEDLDVATRAAYALMELGDEGAASSTIERILKGFADRDVSQRVKDVKRLHRLHAVGPLQQIYESDASLAVREEARKALAKLED